MENVTFSAREIARL